MEDAQIIELYWRRDQSAIAETSEKYGPFLQDVSWNILRSYHDAEECVNDTYLRTWNAIPPNRPSALRAWLGRITRNLSLDRWKQSNAEKRGGGEMAVLLGELDQCLPARGGVESVLEDQEIAAVLSRFLRELSGETRYLFLRRYWYGDSVADIAQKLNCGQARVKSALFRTRKSLRAYLEKEEVFL